MRNTQVFLSKSDEIILVFLEENTLNVKFKQIDLKPNYVISRNSILWRIENRTKTKNETFDKKT